MDDKEELYWNLNRKDTRGNVVGDKRAVDATRRVVWLRVAPSVSMT